MFPIIFSLSGLLFGYLLAEMSTEELLPGKKYLIFFKNFISVGILSLFTFYFFQNNESFLLLFILLSALLFVLQVSRNKLQIDLSLYVLVIPYFIYLNQNFQLMLATLIFLYGFPVGTQLKRI